MQLITNNYLKKIQNQTASVVYDHDGLFGGRLAGVWCAYYNWRATRSHTHRDQALASMAQVFEHLNSGEPQLQGAALSAGAAGFCYVATLLQKDGLLTISLDDDLAELDQYLYESALAMIEARHVDFWHGAFGIIFYFLERLANPTIRQYTNDLVEKAIEQIHGDDDGLWFPNVAKPEDEDIINFGLSHGQSAFFIVLIQAAQKGIQPELIKSVVWRGVNFITKHQTFADFKSNYSLFPLTVNNDTNEAKYKNRLALCYGDLNIVLLLYKAAAYLGDENLTKRANIVGLNSLHRQTEEATMVTDAHLCHGAAGVAQLYRSFHKMTGLDAYRKGYEYWIDKTLAYIDQELETNAYQGHEGSLISGWLGVELVLLHYVSKERLDWDKLFLL